MKEIKNSTNNINCVSFEISVKTFLLKINYNQYSNREIEKKLGLKFQGRNWMWVIRKDKKWASRTRFFEGQVGARGTRWKAGTERMPSNFGRNAEKNF